VQFLATIRSKANEEHHSLNFSLLKLSRAPIPIGTIKKSDKKMINKTCFKQVL
jgi:hypothetical protein